MTIQIMLCSIVENYKRRTAIPIQKKNGDDILQYIIIEKEKDYDLFFTNYISRETNTIKEEYVNEKFIFIIRIKDNCNLDEQILFEYYLIVSRYGVKNQFKLEINLPVSQVDGRAEYHRISTYGFIQENINKIQGTIVYANGQTQRMQHSELKGVRRLVPVFNIESENFRILKKTVDIDMWENIKQGKLFRLNSFENILYRLCWAYLFGEIGDGNKVLSEQRAKAFATKEFNELIVGIPFIAVLIFSMLDFSFREEACDEYKDAIKHYSDKKRIVLTEKDFIYEYQNIQDRVRFEAYKEVCEKKYDNKTIWEDYAKKKLHPYIVKELYEAITISEGILQLLENVIHHAGTCNNGKGMFSMFLRSYEKDRETLEYKYQNYFIKNKEDERSKYYLEVLIADLSGTDIPTKFVKNNMEFFEKNKEKLVEKMGVNGEHILIPPKMFLKDFFQPDKSKRNFWQAFFSFGDKAINHYGLQIFDSIISSKRGLFEVQSGEECYCNLKEELVNGGSYVYGSRYTIFCPLNGVSTDDKNIYDSMFGYSYKNLDKEVINIPQINSANANDYIEHIREKIEEKEWCDKNILCVDTRHVGDLERYVKGLLLYIFEYKEKIENIDSQLLVAFIHCKPHQIIDIVRLLSIYYDKLGQNLRMRGVQVYLRGEKIGEEILFYGDNLQEVSRNIAKSSCMRGIMFDNFQTVNKILEREKGD